MLNSERVAVINSSDQQIGHLVNRLLPLENERISGCGVGSKRFFKRILKGNISTRRNFSEHQLVLGPRHALGIVPVCNRAVLPASVCSEFNVPSDALANVLYVEVIFKQSAKFIRSGTIGSGLDGLEFNPRSFVNTKRFSALSECSTRYAILLDHLTPHERRYHSVSGNCPERSPCSIFYGFLSGVFALILGGKISHRLLVKGDDTPYLYGLIRWQLLIPFSLVCTAYGLGVFVDTVLYLASPCDDFEESHLLNSVPRKCLTCNSCWGTVIDMANVLNTDKRIAVIGALAEGSSIRSIERITGVHRDTIMRLGVKVGKGCASVMDSKMRNLPCRRLEMDEIWGFVGKKDRNVRIGDDAAMGSVWTFCAIDAETKLVPAFKVGDRSVATAKAFVQDVADRMAYRVQISTDGLNAYVAAMESAFGGQVDYAQIIKTYGREETTDNRRYSAPEFVSSEKIIHVGNPDVRLISTSYIERLNATTRLHMRRLTRLTLAFSKKRENFEAAVALHFAYYNFVKRHNTLRCTPAMAAGVASSFWTVGDLVEAAA